MRESDLHIPSPDWRDQVIYFAMLDRFDDGDPGNNDQGADEYDPSRSSHYSGGDLAGLCRRVDYIRDLGATAVWLTPPVANQWWDGEHRFSGYHGYWASSFREVDAHLGNLDDYRQLSAALHRRGMFLVQDIVLNHMGNYFTYGDTADAGDPLQGYRPNSDSRPTSAPSQWPFSLNDPRRPADRAADIYHWLPSIRDFGDRRQELTYALADLDDLNTSNPLVRETLRDSYARWIRDVGVDAFRIDTVFHVEPDLLQDFLYSKDPAHPGIATVASDSGRVDFLAFGEGFGIERAGEDRVARKIDSYLRDANGQAILDGMLNFPLYSALNSVFGKGAAPMELGQRIQSTMKQFADPWRMPTFIDNHDVDRFLAGGSEPGFRQALLAMLTLPGIPVIYYGTEQGLREQRASLFAGGYGSGGVDHFDPQAPLYHYLQSAIALRRDNPLFSRGKPRVLRGDAAGPGVLAYTMQWQEQRALVVFNTADQPVLLDHLDTDWAAGTRLQPVFSLQPEAQEAALDRTGRLSLLLPARAGIVWIPSGLQPAISPTVNWTISDIDEVVPGDTPLAVSGRADGVRELQLAVDGYTRDARRFEVEADGSWQASVSVDAFVDPTLTHRLVTYSQSPLRISEARTFRVQPRWQSPVVIDDPAGDDHGPTGRYSYPSGSGWDDNHPADIRRVMVQRSGGSLRVDISMAQLLSQWNAPNDFDHLSLSLFIELPDQPGGRRDMPQQHADLPGDMRWHYRARVGGWGSALFRAEPFSDTAAADSDNEGTPVSPAPMLLIDRSRQRVTLLLSGSSLGTPASLDGARLYLSSWDYDGGYRGLAIEPGPNQFGSGAASGTDARADSARVMDDTAIITLPSSAAASEKDAEVD